MERNQSLLVKRTFSALRSSDVKRKRCSNSFVSFQELYNVLDSLLEFPEIISFSEIFMHHEFAQLFISRDRYDLILHQNLFLSESAFVESDNMTRNLEALFEAIKERKQDNSKFPLLLSTGLFSPMNLKEFFAQRRNGEKQNKLTDEKDRGTFFFQSKDLITTY
jgi:hypothetical protein